jgi:hypothetical protein
MVTTIQGLVQHNFRFTGQIYNADNDYTYALLLKTDSLGNMVWNKMLGHRYEAGSQIIETSDKSILIGGLTFSFPTTVIDEDWYLVKTDTAGTVIWERGYGNGSLYDGAIAGIIETQDSNYIACGGFPAFNDATDSYWDGCLRKVSKDGDLLWTKFYRTYSKYTESVTTMYDYIYGIYEDSIGNIYSISSTFDSKPFYRGCFTKLNSHGDIMFRRLYYAIDEFSNEQYLTVFKPTNDGGFILAGYGNAYDWYDYNPPQQAWLVKTDSLGIDGLCYTEPPALNIDLVLPATMNCNDTIAVYAYIAGKSAPYTIETSIGQLIDSIYYPPLFVPIEIGLSETYIELENNSHYSELITEATLSNHEWGQCIAKPIEFYTPHTSGTHQINITVTDAYGESKTITKEVFVNDNCGSRIASEIINPISLYPNPVRDKVYVDIPQASTPLASTPLSHRVVKGEIYNVAGQIVASPAIHAGLNVIGVSDLSSGVYVLKINSDNQSYSLSFEKE